MKINLTILFILWSFSLLSQVNEEVPELNPQLSDFSVPSPEVSSLLKFVETPVGEATGIPEITIPFYSFSDGIAGTNVNISLDYHGGGIRVAENASREGIGWSLNAGGVISRNLRGIKDELEDFGFWDYTIPTEANGNSPGTPSERPFNDMYYNVIDNQPDVFTYSFPGGSGKFIIGKNNDILQLDQKNLEIEYEVANLSPTSSGSDISSFSLTDENGIEYHFEAVEFIQKMPVDVNDFYASSWFLTKIVSKDKNNQAIEFFYENESFNTYSVAYNHSQIWPVMGTSGNVTYNSSSSSQDIQTKRLTRIEFPNGVNAKFNYTDFSNFNNSSLSEIIIEDNKDSKKYKLFHDNSLNRRTLNKIELFENLNKIGEYSFEYNSALPPKNTVPDHWGFHNGGGSTWIPKEIFDGGLSNTGYNELPGGSRDTNPSSVKAGSLRKITYPTGGYTEYEMEANQAKDPRLNINFEKIVTRDVDTVINSINTTVSSDYSFGQMAEGFYFTGEANTLHTVHARIDQGFLNQSVQPKVTFELHSSSNFYAPPLIRRVIPISMYGHNEVEVNTTSLVPGNTYYAIFYTNNMDSYYSYATVNVEFLKKDQNVVKNYSHVQYYVGGLRVRSIKSYLPDDSSPVLEKKFSYVLEDGETTSGTLGAYPVYSYPAYYEFRRTASGAYLKPNPAPEIYNTGAAPNVVIRSNSPIFQLPSYLGSPVIYKRVVTESIKRGSNTSNGKDIKYFTGFDSPPVNIDYTFPFKPTEVDDWMYGLLKDHVVLNQNGDSIRRVTNTYHFSHDNYYASHYRRNNFEGVSIVPVMYFIGNYQPNYGEIPINQGSPVYFKADYFYPSAGRSDILTQKIKYYDSSGQLSGLTEFKKYKYEDTYHKVSYLTKALSNGDTLKTSFEYPFQFLSNPVYSEMIVRNNLNEVITKKTSVKKKGENTYQELVRLKNEYNFFNGNLLKLNEIFTSKDDNLLESRVLYHSYDGYGNPLEVSNSDGTLIFYLWGYGGQYPIAKIENTTEAALENELGVLQNVNESDLQSINNLRSNSAFKEAMITTFTYDPLVGMTSMTDPRGRTTTYKYDGFGRLDWVKDHEGKLLEEYEYHYKGE
jgi:hypothetical protein